MPYDYLGRQYGPPPYFGEEAITGTRIDYGYQLAPSLPDNWLIQMENVAPY
jgi:hypothetical protein